MKKLIGGLALKIIIISLIVLSVSVFTFTIFSVALSIKENQTDLKEPYAYTFGSSAITDSDYNNNSVFEINSVDGFKSFCASTWKWSSGGISAKTENLTYENKTVKLVSDISLKSSDEDSRQYGNSLTAYYFAGTFDGQKHKITYSDYERTTGVKGILCDYLKGTLKNTIFEIDVYVDGGTLNDTPVTYIGIIGKNLGVVDSCIVTDTTIVSNRWDKNCQFGVLAGVNEGTVRNCLIKGDYTFGGENENWPLNQGVTVNCFVASGNSASCCIFMASVKPNTGKNSTNNTGSLGDGNYGSCADAYGSIGNRSTDCGESDDYTIAWFQYRAKDYGYGQDSTYCVYLRAFIGWTTYYFTVEDSNKGYVNPSDITIPTDYVSVEISGAKVSVGYSKSSQAFGKAGYSFSKWVSVGMTYTAYFTNKICQIKFYNYDSNVIVETSNLELDTFYNMAYEANLKITYDRCERDTYDYTDYGAEGLETETLICLNSLTFQFTDTGGVTRTIIYKPINSSYFLGVNVNGIKSWMYDYYYEGDNDFAPNILDTFQDPYVFLKEYNVTFQ
ncbi:MAG: hypothetical protein IJ415_01420 [Clostridia bacterium]|nr:hypothetical protein [Clostridia bacterium]